MQQRLSNVDWSTLPNGIADCRPQTDDLATKNATLKADTAAMRDKVETLEKKQSELVSTAEQTRGDLMRELRTARDATRKSEQTVRRLNEKYFLVHVCFLHISASTILCKARLNCMHGLPRCHDGGVKNNANALRGHRPPSLSLFSSHPLHRYATTLQDLVDLQSKRGLAMPPKSGAPENDGTDDADDAVDGEAYDLLSALTEAAAVPLSKAIPIKVPTHCTGGSVRQTWEKMAAQCTLA